MKWAPLSLLLALLAGCNATDSAIREDPEHAPDKLAEIDTQLGIEYMRDGQNDVAMRKLQKAINADPNYASAYNVLGLLYLRLGENDKANASFKKALDLSPKDPEVLNNYGLFLCHQGDATQAQTLFARAVQNPLYKTPEAAYTNAGICAREQQKDLAAAEKFFRQALNAEPKMPTALLEMARVCVAQQKYLPARGYLQRYVEVAPQTAQSLWLGVQVEHQLGDRDAESSYALSLKRNFPDAEETHKLLESGAP